MADEKNSHRDLMVNMTDYSRGADDSGYIDGLVSAKPDPAPAAAIPVGEKIREIREQKKLSRLDLAQRTGLTEEQVREVEEELISPNLGTLIKLSKALDMKMGTLISSADPKPYTIVRADERKAVSRYGSKEGQKRGYAYQHLAYDKGDRSMEPFLVTLDPGAVEEEKNAHDGEEFIFILSGQMEAFLEEDREVLKPGDSIYYNSSVPHLVRCFGDEPAVILAVIYPGNG